MPPESAPATPAITAPANPTVVTNTPAVEGGKIHGTVAAAGGTGKNAAPGIPLPGVAITATNTLTGRKYTTSTDVDGRFALAIPKNGRYVVRAELAAFATGAQEIVLNSTQHEGAAAFTLELASRVKPTAEESTTDTAVEAMESVQNSGRGVQALGVHNGTDAATEDATAAGSNANNGTSLPSLSGFDTSSDSVSISGQMGQTNGLANYSEDEVRTRIADAIREARENGGTAMDGMNNAVSVLGGMMSGAGGPGMRGGGGSRGGGGGSMRGGRGGGMSSGGFSVSRGNFKGFNPGQIHGNAYYYAGNAALDATQFSVAGTPFKPDYATNRYGASLTGSPYIPGLTQPNPAQFLFLNFTGQKSTSPVNITGIVPTLAQRSGDLSGLRPVYDPQTGTQFANNQIPNARISDAAKALLNYFPLPNVSSAQGYNYQRIATQGTNVTQLSTRFVRNFGQNAGQRGGGFFGSRFSGGSRGERRQQQNTLRQNINVGFNYQHSAADSRRTFVASDSKTSSEGYGLSAGYVIGYGRLNVSTSVSWNRSHSLTTNNFTYNLNDPSNGLNIPRPASFEPGFYSGLPSLGITNFTGLSGVSPSDRVVQTISLSEYVGWNHHKHNYRFGFSVRRLHHDVIGGNNGMGSLSFTGYATQDGTNSTSTGAGLADFLLGAPQQSKIQAGQYKTYLRDWIFSGYAQDDWRIRNNLTLNAGLRYEYFSPYVEKYDRLVNLYPNADFSAVDVVRADQRPSGVPRSLINPDRTMFSPRLGIAWTPTKYVKQLVVRAGYGINYNTSQYSSFANSLSYQPPFAITQTNTANEFNCGNINSGFTITNAFGCTNVTQNNFAVDRFYRLGRVQVINVDIQKTFPLGIVGNIGYNGSLGSNLDMRRSPNRTSTTNATTVNTQAFLFEDAIGDSRFHALSVSARKRMSRGIALGATYIYGHSIDNASSVNGTGNNTIPQIDKRLDLEYGNSTFDIRHQVSGDFVTELPFGPNRLWLTKGGFWSTALDGFSFSGNFKFASGTYYTPQFQGTSTQVASGGNYTQRPDRVVGQPINDGPDTGTLKKWFNTAAFSREAPVSPDGYGTAQRNAIEGPGTVSVNMTLSRSQRLGEGTKNIEARITASNVFNTVQYSGINVVVNSPYYGQVTSAAAPRKLTLQARYRF
ncbi:MAG: TonB-dependent receptor [Acidobacteria bacterium]|nr:TonB-dependent receptor [Acidobacteriota bacterium]